MNNSVFLLPKNSEINEKVVTVGDDGYASRQRPVLLDIQDINRASKRKPKSKKAEPTYAIVKILKYTVEVWIPSSPMPPMGDAEGGKKKAKDTSFIFSDETNEERSIRRTKLVISDLIQSNDFDWFCTFTFDPKKIDRTNVKRVKRAMNTWLKHQRKHSPDFGYLAVPEFHKDGKAIHFHILIKDYERPLEFYRTNKSGRDVFNIPGFKLGHNTAVAMDGNYMAVMFYVRKYITKDMPLLSNKHRYWASQNLMRPRIVYNPDAWYVEEQPINIFSNKHGFKLTFDINELSYATELGLK